MTTETASRTSEAHAFQLKGSLFTLSALQLMTADIAAITKQLEQTIRSAPKFFEAAPIVLDLHLLPANSQVDFAALLTAIRAKNLIPVGVRGGHKQLMQTATEHGLALLALSKAPEPKLKKSLPNSEHQSALLIDKPVRSGQQFYAKDTDLIVMGPVSHGAELLADGNIHVYGPLRGRALAGIGGDEQARIFCHSLEAELISIAGRYVLNETLRIKPHYQQAVQAYLANGTIELANLS